MSRTASHQSTYRRVDMARAAHRARAYLPDLVADVARLFRTTPDEVLGASRFSRNADARHVVAWVLREADLSFPSIAALMDRDHSTIIHAVRRVDSDPALLIHAYGLAAKYATTQPTGATR